MSFERKMQREKIKKEYNTNKIDKAWKLHQEQKYIILGYAILQKKNKKRR